MSDPDGGEKREQMRVMRRFRFRSRLFQARVVAFSVLISAIVLLGAVLVLVLLDERSSGGDAAPLAAASAAAAEGAKAAAAKLDARMEAAATEAQAGGRSGDLSSLSVFEVAPPLRSVDAASFRDGERIIRLAGVEAPRAGAVCLDDEVRWSCGLQARAALHNTVANRSLFCQPRRATADGNLAADCRLEAKDALPAGDVARLLVQQGWVRPMPERDGALAADMEKAKTIRAGLWRGDWRIVAP